MFIILPLSATMAMSGTYEHLTKFQPTGRLISVQILSSVIGQGLITICFQVIITPLLACINYLIAYHLEFIGQTTLVPSISGRLR